MKHEDMVCILDHLHQYVPTKSVEDRVELPGLPEGLDVTIDHFHYILFGGDMLTEMRARTARNIRSNSDRGRDRLEGVIPIIEDWHAKVCFLEVSQLAIADTCATLILLLYIHVCTMFHHLFILYRLYISVYIAVPLDVTWGRCIRFVT